MEPLRNDPLKKINNPTKVTYEHLTPDGKTFDKHLNHLIPYQPKELSFFPHIQSYNEQNPETFHDSDTSDMLKNDYTPYDLSESDDNVFDDDPFCNFDDEQSIMFDDELYKFKKLDDNHYHF